MRIVARAPTILAAVLAVLMGTGCRSGGSSTAQSSSSSSASPLTSVSALLTDASSGTRTSNDASSARAREAIGVAAGIDHACAWFSDGSVWCWGRNQFGQLGDRTTVDRAKPVRVEGLANVAAVSPGTLHTCARLGGGEVRCWGSNNVGQLGDGTASSRLEPSTPVGLAHVVEIVAGHQSSCARTEDKGVFCWGWNGYGQVGDGTRIDRLQPTAVLGLPSVKRLGVGGGHACALSNEGLVLCWGRNDWGQLGDGMQGKGRIRTKPGAVVASADNVELAVGFGQACTVTHAGGATCWGGNDVGQLGSGAAYNQILPEPVRDLTGVTALALSGDHACAMNDDGALWCWGANGSWQLGPNVERPSLGKPEATPSVTGMVSVTTGSGFTCGLTKSRAVACWGNNRYGQLGDGTHENRRAPAALVFEDAVPPSDATLLTDAALLDAAH